jgi:hypothetical protein
LDTVLSAFHNPFILCLDYPHNTAVGEVVGQARRPTAVVTPVVSATNAQASKTCTRLRRSHHLPTCHIALNAFVFPHGPPISFRIPEEPVPQPFWSLDMFLIWGEGFHLLRLEIILFPAFKNPKGAELSLSSFFSSFL